MFVLYLAIKLILQPWKPFYQKKSLILINLKIYATNLPIFFLLLTPCQFIALRLAHLVISVMIPLCFFKVLTFLIL